MKPSAAVAAVLACTTVVFAGCTAPGPDHSLPSRGAALAGHYGGDGPGSLVSAESLVDLDPALRVRTSLAARITYISTSGISDGHPHVTGAVFVPTGDPPAGGWKTVALGHPATGIQPDCAPSHSPTLLGLLPTVIALIDAGYLVTVSDYQGLGLRDTYHPFLDSATEGHNLIDSVRAARDLVPAASDTFAVWGQGQGGQAAWAANELVADYNGKTRMVGAVAQAPTAALDWLADAAAAGTLTHDQQLMLQQYLASLKREYNDFNVDAYRHGVVKNNWDVLSACWGDAVRDRARVVGQIGPDDLRPDSPDATQALRGYLQKTSLPQAPTAAPMLVVPDDAGGLIPWEQTAAALARACAMGDVIQLGPPQGEDVVSWINDRFNAVSARNDCGNLLAPTPP
ncbi:MAG TPA: lipase family protein [Mycobacterium sp.]|nr:lipase family protein [Mycobacterium sp.]